MEKGGHGHRHTHPHSAHLLVVRKGELIVRNSAESYRVPKDSAILFYPGEEHEIINSHDGTSQYWVIPAQDTPEQEHAKHSKENLKSYVRAPQFWHHLKYVLTEEGPLYRRKLPSGSRMNLSIRVSIK